MDEIRRLGSDEVVPWAGWSQIPKPGGYNSRSAGAWTNTGVGQEKEIREMSTQSLSLSFDLDGTWGDVMGGVRNTDCEGPDTVTDTGGRAKRSNSLSHSYLSSTSNDSLRSLALPPITPKARVVVVQSGEKVEPHRKSIGGSSHRRRSAIAQISSQEPGSLIVLPITRSSPLTGLQSTSSSIFSSPPFVAAGCGAASPLVLAPLAPPK